MRTADCGTVEDVALALDPGTYDTGWVEYGLETSTIYNAGTMPNEDLLSSILDPLDQRCDYLLLEDWEPRGMSWVTTDQITTIKWIGRFVQAYLGDETEMEPHVICIPRQKILYHLCGKKTGGDSAINGALYDRFGGGRQAAVGVKKAPGPCYGVKGHAWQALAVACVYQDLMQEENDE